MPSSSREPYFAVMTEKPREPANAATNSMASATSESGDVWDDQDDEVEAHLTLSNRDWLDGAAREISIRFSQLPPRAT